MPENMDLPAQCVASNLRTCPKTTIGYISALDSLTYVPDGTQNPWF